MKSRKIILVCGKNPQTAPGGYASYTHSLAKNLSKLKIPYEIYTCGKRCEVHNYEFGKIHVVGASILKLKFFQGVEMAALPILAIQLGFVISKNVDDGTIIWGVGPWSLAGVVVKLLSRKKITLYSDYFTTIRHEFRGSMEAVTAADYGLAKYITNVIIFTIVVPIFSLAERVIFNFSDKIIVHYESTQDIIMNEFSVWKRKFVYLPYSPRLSFKKIKASKKALKKFKKPFILLVTRHDGRKGINFLLHAFSILNERNIKFSAVIIGAGKMFEANKKIVRTLNLKNVELLGYVADLKPYFKLADIYAFPSVEEGSSAISILEAMEQGLPIVSTDVDGIPEDLTNGKSALLLPPANSAALADALEKLIIDPSLRKKLGLNAKKEFDKKFGSFKFTRELKILLSR